LVHSIVGLMGRFASRGMDIADGTTCKLARHWTREFGVVFQQSNLIATLMWGRTAAGRRP